MDVRRVLNVVSRRSAFASFILVIGVDKLYICVIVCEIVMFIFD